MGAAGAVAGCIDTGGNDRDDEELTPEDHEFLFESELGVEVREFEVEDSIARLHYDESSVAENEIRQEIQSIAGTYAARVAQGWHVERLDGTGYQDDEAARTWYVEREWAEQYNSQDMMLEEFSSNIYDTIEEV